MRRLLASLSIAAILAVSAPALADDAPAKDKDAKSDIQLPPMSPDKTIAQEVQVGGRVLR